MLRDLELSGPDKVSAADDSDDGFGRISCCSDAQTLQSLRPHMLSQSLDTLLILVIAGTLIAIACLCGICILLIKWRGKTAGITLGAIVFFIGISTLGMVTLTTPRYWWISVPPIILGIQCIRAWAREHSHARFTPSSLLLVVAVAGLMCGGIGQLYRQMRLEQPIVEKLQSHMDGEIQRDFDGIVTGIILYGTTVEELDETLSLAVQLRCLQRLQIGNGQLTHTHAKLIGDLVHLRHLGLQATDFDDEMLPELARLKRLETLDLMQTDVTGAGLKFLYDSTSLAHLWIDRDKISPAEVNQLRTALPNLEVGY